jgi:iron(III) transport system substrate-binding protein
MNNRRPLYLALLAPLAALSLAACGSSSSTSATSTSAIADGEPGALAGQSITLYNGQHEQTTALLVKAFERQTHVKVNVRSDDEATLAEQILQEGANSPADVFYTENTPPLEALREHGRLARLAPATLASVPSRYSSQEGYWVGVSARASVLVYNTRLLSASQLPNSILELAQPKWRGKIGFAPSETDFQPLVTAITKEDGAAAAEKWLAALKENGKIYPDNETVVAQVNNGESAIGPINHYYWFRLRDEVGTSGLHSALHYFTAHDPGDLVDVSGAAVLSSSAHMAAAQAFVAFLVSQTGQEVLAHSHSYEYPLRPGVSPASGLRPFDQLQPVDLSPAELGDGSGALELEQKLGLL